MAVAFVIVEEGGKYDDAWKNVICASLSKEIIEVQKLKLENELDQYNSIVDMISELNTKIVDDFGYINFEKQLEYPRWKAGLGKEQITQEMRNERTKIELLNKQINIRNSMKQQERSDMIRAAIKELLLSLGYSESLDSEYFANIYWMKKDINYSIEEIPLF